MCLPFAKHLTTEILRSGKDAPFTRVYQIGVEKQTNAKGTFWIYKLRKFPKNNQYAMFVQKQELLDAGARVAAGAKQFRNIAALTDEVEESSVDTGDVSFDYGADAEQA